MFRSETQEAGEAAMSAQSDDDPGISKQFAIIVERPAMNGSPPMVDYVNAHNRRLIEHTSTIRPPPADYTYSMLELKEALALLRRSYPGAQIEAHEVAHIDALAMSERWSKARREWKRALGLDPDKPINSG
jgi:hypothetical protein